MSSRSFLMAETLSDGRRSFSNLRYSPDNPSTSSRYIRSDLLSSRARRFRETSERRVKPSWAIRLAVAV